MTSPSVRCDDREGAVLARARHRLWTAVRAGDGRGASAAVFDALGPATDAQTVLLGVIAPVRVRAGAERAANRLTVAQEHTATAIRERVVGALTRHPGHRNDTPESPRVTVACVDGERHALPARLLIVARTRHLLLDFAMDLLAGWFKDFPRARRTLCRAREALATRTPSPQVPGHGKSA
ncbi:B12-binding domain-containing protein [Streptomyces sp. NPDC057950]|uniref:B12-binding domain-containing protein n=1 Tax=Streptomyces sp. NPDC057950 TaxID=3346288 RepID=UPI0036E23900